MTTNISKLALAVASASLISSTAMASGFKLNEQSASGVGTAYAGRTAVVEDASTVYYNPAGMSKLTRPEISVGGAYINIDAKFSNGERTNPLGVSSDIEGGYDHGGSLIPATSIPFVYYAHPINEKLALGFGIFVPFGAHTEYSDTALSGGFAGKTELTTIDFQPAFSYKINDTLAIGGGLDIVYAKGTLSKQLDLVPYVPTEIADQMGPLGVLINASNLSDPSYKGYENTFSVEGDDIAFGWNLGLMWDITPETTLGVTYRSQVKFTLEGDAEFVKKEGVVAFAPEYAQSGICGTATQPSCVLPVDGQTGKVSDQAAKVPLTGPQNATISLAHRFTDKFQLQGGITWTDWSSFKYFDVIGTEPGLISSLTPLNKDEHAGKHYIGHIVENWSDSYAYAIGGTYTLNNQWLFRAGFAYDEAPVDKNHRTARVPDNDRKWLTAGARYTVNQDMSFDLGLAYLIMSDFSMSEVNYDLNDEKILPESISGNYSMDAFGISAQMNYRF